MKLTNHPKILFSLRVMIVSFTLFSCQKNSDDIVQPSTDQSHDLYNFIFTDQEVDKMLNERFNSTDFSFEEKMLFLNEFVIDKLDTTQVDNSTSTRVLDICDNPASYVLLSAGVYHNGNWDFKTKIGSINSFVYLNNSMRISSPNNVGSSTSVWTSPNGTHFCDLAYIESVNPIFLNCGEDGIRATANNQWWSGTPVLQVSVSCDD
ncbi:hypothetical protein [Reichenbachiella agariperforans]|uniref:hypothetical protein n=1 Tax=Reichenbachiella agariperforans TaxID=156994 RepID=UPI001C08C429|nr:hypothetical protein [Reichenbachiella agariperforans]MBU2915123.1 hypothetical protein [Reichenbachiella agariperforans]